MTSASGLTALKRQWKKEKQASWKIFLIEQVQKLIKTASTENFSKKWGKNHEKATSTGSD